MSFRLMLTDWMLRRLQLSKWITLSCSKDHTAKIWELSSRECRGTLAGAASHEVDIKVVASYSDGHLARMGRYVFNQHES